MSAGIAKPDRKSSLERELDSIREIVRALRRLDSDAQQVRAVSSAFAHVKSVRVAEVTVELLTRTGITWK